MLFTVVTREEKYKAKNFIAVSGWAFAALTGVGIGMTGVALVALPLAVAWIPHRALPRSPRGSASGPRFTEFRL
jgi:hypothetical protein